MKKEVYNEQRTALLAAAQTALEAGDMEAFEARTGEVEALDARFEAEARAQANLDALAGRGVGGSPMQGAAGAGAVDLTGGAGAPVDAGDDPLNDRAYRVSFMNYVMHGERIPAKLSNSDETTKTTDGSVLVPTVVLERIIEKMEHVGHILPLVTRTAYKGGVKVPVSTVKPVATWVAEGAGSDKQKKTVGMISFSYNKLRCAVSMTLEMDVMALPVFETTFVNNVSEAMVKALEQSILLGTGAGQPKGILTETAPEGQAFELAKGKTIDYKLLCAMEAALPLSYESDASWLMTKKTFMECVAMTDTNGQPIARVSYGIGGRPERTLLGRTVILNDYMQSYAATPAADGVIAALFTMTDYILNTNLGMTIKRYEDNDSDDQVTKAVMLADGCVVDNGSLVTLSQKKATA